MRIVVFGASGRTGQRLVKQALAKGWSVRAFVRPGAAWVAPAGVEVVRGELGDAGAAAAVARAVEGVDAVAVTLGLHRRRPSPWSRVTSPPKLLSTATAHVLAAMRQHGVSRVVYLSAHGVGDSEPRLGLRRRVLVRFQGVGVAWRDHARAEKLLRDAGVRWTVVRPGALDDNARHQRAQVVPDGPVLPLQREDVAAFLVTCLEGAHVGEAVSIGA